MKVLALTRYERLGASSRLRFLQYLPALKELGVDVEVSALMPNLYLERLYADKGRSIFALVTSYALRAAVLLRVRRFDLIWIEKELFPGLPAWAESALSASGVRYVVDFDDAVFHNYDRVKGVWGRLLARKIDAVMRCATTVIVGSPYLGERAVLAGASDVYQLPTVVDLDRYSKITASPEVDELVVGWIGSPSTVKYLEIIAPSLARLAMEIPLRLQVVGAKFAWPGLIVQCLDWQEDTEVKCIQGFDIGVMPLENSDWERGKCGYKLIQCMACGIPVVASPVGVNMDIVKPGQNGFLASTPQEWLSSLRALLQDEVLRKKLGQTGRRDVEQSYSLQLAVPKLFRWLQQAVVSAKVAD